MGYLQILGAVSIWAFFNGVLVKGIKTSGVGVGMWTGIIGVIFCLVWQDTGQLLNLNHLFWLALLDDARNMSGTMPLLDLAFGFARFCNKSVTILACPRSAAYIRGVIP